MDLYSWFVGTDENPVIRLAANSDNTFSIENPTDRKHKLVIQAQDGQELASSADVMPGQTGQLAFKPTSGAGTTLEYMCYYHSPMKGTIQIQ